MGKKILLLMILAGAVALSGCSLGQQKTQPVSQQPGAMQQPAEAQKNEVKIKNFAFDPQELTVSVGTTVTWKNEDTALHTIKSGTFNSQTLKTGDTFSFTFNTAGSYAYTCGIHPSMKGTIIVK